MNTNLVDTDPLWKEAAGFLVREIRAGTLVVAPREFTHEHFTTLGYEFSLSFDASRSLGVVVAHKGLLDEVPLALLKTVAGPGWTPVFANPVFVVFFQQTSHLRAEGEHVFAFHRKLRDLIDRDKMLRASPHRPFNDTELIVLDVVGPDELHTTLQDLGTSHLPTVVASAAGRESAMGSDFDCGRFLVPAPCSRGELLHRVMTARLCASPANWFSIFQSGVRVRADMPQAMEFLQAESVRPFLTGYWDKNLGIRQEWNLHGYRLLEPRLRNDKHVHVHRDYWRRHLGALSLQPHAGDLQDRVFRLLASRTRGVAVPGLVW